MVNRGKCPDDFVAIGGVPVCTAAISAASSTWRSQTSELAVWRKSAHDKLDKFLDEQEKKGQLAGRFWQQHIEKEQEEQRRKEEEQKKKQRESSARRQKENKEKDNERKRGYYYYYNFY